VTEAAASTAVGRSSTPPVRDPHPSDDRPGTPASADQSAEPDDLGRPPQIVLDTEEVVLEIVEEVACDTLVDLMSEQPCLTLSKFMQIIEQSNNLY